MSRPQKSDRTFFSFFFLIFFQFKSNHINKYICIIINLEGLKKKKKKKKKKAISNIFHFVHLCTFVHQEFLKNHHKIIILIYYVQLFYPTNLLHQMVHVRFFFFFFPSFPITQKKQGSSVYIPEGSRLKPMNSMIQKALIELLFSISALNTT